VRRAVAALAIVPALFLVGCGAAVDSGPTVGTGVDGEVAKVNVEGTECVIYDASGGGGGVSCDWGTP
jgi:hypothetical protein